jgi:hypothetical protein
VKRLWTIVVLMIFGAVTYASEPPELTFEVLLAGTRSRIDHTAIFYIRGENEWQEFWSSHRGDDLEDRPAVDFDKHSIIGFLAGHRGSTGYEVAIERITVHPDWLSLDVHEIYAGARCVVVDMPTRPFQLVKIARRSPIEVIDFSLRRTARKCE